MNQGIKKYRFVCTVFDPPFCSYVSEEIITDTELDGLSPEEYADEVFRDISRDVQDCNVFIEAIKD